MGFGLRRAWLRVALVACLAAFNLVACGDDDDDEAFAGFPGDDDLAVRGEDDDFVDDDLDDDTGDDDDDDDTTPPPVTDEARSAGFRLFYRERVERLLLAWNRYGLAGDAAWGTNIHKHFIARSGNAFEVQAGESDNNDIGLSIWAAWHGYKNFGGRDAELTLIRMFEGLRFYEAVTGLGGITSREVLPGWTRVMDGVNDTISRTRGGAPFTPPVTYPPELEQEILDTFYDGLIYTYREDPGEYYWNFKPIAELRDFATTLVFSEQGNFMRISDCCGSWMISKLGPWTGAYWSNHNSRDNFPDMSLGYLAAFEAARDQSLPADVREAAQHAEAAGHAVGDRIVADQNIQMTSAEGRAYDDLIPGGAVRPDGSVEWQDLGSLAACQTAYLAKALSTEGLDVPVPEVPLPGSIEMSALRLLLGMIGIEDPLLPVLTCTSLDDAFFGRTWRELLDGELFGKPWTEIAFLLASLFPDLFPQLLGSTGDDFKELEMGAMAVCYYADLTGKDDLLDAARDTLRNLIEMHHILAELVYGGAAAAVGTPREAAYRDLIASTEEHLYVAAFMASLYGIPADLEDFDGFSRGLAQNAYLESALAIGDTSPWTLLTDEEIFQIVERELAEGVNGPWIVERYRNRFGYTPPVRRAGDGYEAIGPDGEWQPAEPPRHVVYSFGKLLYEMPLCTQAPWVLSCDWARLGCARPDLNGSGAVDADDQALFDAAWNTYQGTACDDANAWCEGADLDRSGAADESDQTFMAAAQGCVR